MTTEQYDANNAIAHKHEVLRERYVVRSKKFWQRHGKVNNKGEMEIKDPMLIKKAVAIQNKIDSENFLVLRYLLRGRIVWQGFV